MDYSGRMQGSILIVEDEDLLRWSINKYLMDHGFQVTACKDSASALQLLAEKTFDVVITDLMLEGINGLAVSDAAHRGNPECQVIIITGQGSKESVINALRRGVFDYLEKPFRLDMLLINVEKAIQKTTLMRELVRLSRTDGLTGLFNQRYLYEVLEREISRARRQGHKLSLIMVDVDSFKEYNDKHGHLEGDEALVRIAACLIEACRKDTDSAFRYGGDEFVLILPEASQQTAEDVAGRIQAMVRQLNLEGITISLGLAEVSEKDVIKSFIRRADQAMYLAKQMGGNRTITFT